MSSVDFFVEYMLHNLLYNALRHVSLERSRLSTPNTTRPVEIFSARYIYKCYKGILYIMNAVKHSNTMMGAAVARHLLVAEYAGGGCVGCCCGGAGGIVAVLSNAMVAVPF